MTEKPTRKGDENVHVGAQPSVNRRGFLKGVATLPVGAVLGPSVSTVGLTAIDMQIARSMSIFAAMYFDEYGMPSWYERPSLFKPVCALSDIFVNDNIQASMWLDALSELLDFLRVVNSETPVASLSNGNMHKILEVLPNNNLSPDFGQKSIENKDYFINALQKLGINTFGDLSIKLTDALCAIANDKKTLASVPAHNLDHMERMINLVRAFISKNELQDDEELISRLDGVEKIVEQEKDYRKRDVSRYTEYDVQLTVINDTTLQVLVHIPVFANVKLRSRHIFAFILRQVNFYPYSLRMRPGFYYEKSYLKLFFDASSNLVSSLPRELNGRIKLCV